MYTRTKCAGILLKIYPQKIHCEQKKNEVDISDEELVLMFLKKRRKKRRFWVHQFPMRRQ